MLTINDIIDDLKLYYSSDQFQDLTGYTYKEISEEALRAFFADHCHKHAVTVDAGDLSEKYKDNFILINTPDGFQEIGDLYIKGPYRIFTVKTPEYEIRCSEGHLLQTPSGWVSAEKISNGDTVLTKSGYQTVTYTYEHSQKEVTYDWEVLHENHRYWAGSGISSHNTGKTFLACSCTREAQRMGYTVVYMDSEGAIDAKFVSRLGVDPTKLIIKQVSTIAETSQFIANVCKGLQEQEDTYGVHQKVMFVLDSLGNLTSDKERDDVMSGNNKRDMTKAQELKALFRVNATPLARLQCPLVCCNHSYAAIGSYVPAQVMAGGCLTPDEKVITLEHGNIPIKDIKEGEHVLSHDNGWHVVEKTWNYQKPTFTIEFDGATMTCSDTHRFLINIDEPENEASWKTAEELQEGDEIYIMKYTKIRVIKKIYNPEKTDVCDLTVADTANYVTANGIINHNSGLIYNSSVTIELSAAKLDDKLNDKAASEKAGAEALTKTGVLVTAKPAKSRFCRPVKVKFQIPFFKKPNPYAGLEAFMTWDNSGVCRGNVLSEKEFQKLSDGDKKKCYPFDYQGETRYCLPKDTARGIVVKHLGEAVPLIDFFSDRVFTQEFLEYLNENVIKPMFSLPDQSSFEDIKDIEETLEMGEDSISVPTPDSPDMPPAPEGMPVVG